MDHAGIQGERLSHTLCQLFVKSLVYGSDSVLRLFMTTCMQVSDIIIILNSTYIALCGHFTGSPVYEI